MCDPISIGLTFVGSGLQMYGQSQVAGAQRRDINAAGKSYEAERGRQQGFEQENQGTVADTLATYSRPATDQRVASATDARQKSYVAPLSSKSFVADAPANYDANSAVMSRNAQTGGAEKGKAISQALAKAKLDAYGDAQTGGNIAADNNASKVGMVARIARGSQNAEAVQQGTLQSKLEADKAAGSFAGGLGDLFTVAGMLGAGGGAHSLFGAQGGLGANLFGGKLSGFGGAMPASVGGGTFSTGSPAYAGVFR